VSLTAEQRAVRLTGVGASEIGAIVGVNPYREAIDIWCRKPTPSRPPLIVDTDDDDRANVGSELEEGLVRLYTKRTGIEIAPIKQTYRHADLPFVLASPDGLTIANDDGGTECKVVGARVAHHWDDGVPEYVVTQAAQNMLVMDRAWWDVIALINGTELRITRIDRDPDIEAALIEANSYFWLENVEGDVPPEPTSADARVRYVRARYPGTRRDFLRVGADPGLAELAQQYAEAKAAEKAAEELRKGLEAQMCERVGAAYGIEGNWGKFSWSPQAGQIRWKEIAEEVAGGSVPLALIEKHRGEPFRKPLLTMKKTTTTTRTR
jgi:putative phage-type endonuclease